MKREKRIVQAAEDFVAAYSLQQMLGVPEIQVEKEMTELFEAVNG